jgi:uncharacterized protein
MAKLLSALLIAAITAAAVPAAAQEGKQLEFMSFPQGSLAYIVVTSIASQAAKRSGYSVLPVPYAGPQVFIPKLDKGEGALALVNVGEAKQAYTGTKSYDKALRNLRLVSIGYEQSVAPLVTVKSGITDAHTLKGKPVAGEYSAHPGCLDLATAVLADLWMGWSDVQVIPVQSSVPGIRVVGEGRAAASVCAAPDLAIVKETQIRTPLRFLSIDPSPAAVQRARAVFPGMQPRKVKAGTTESFLEDTETFAYNFYLLTNANLPDDAIYAMAKTVWDALPELEQVHTVFKTWLRERMAEADVQVPYHPGAIRFYKEVGVWSDEKDAATKRLLSGM